jgi:hypothetical protein
MGDVLSAEEVRNQTIAAMPAPLGEVCYSLSNEVASLHLKWNDFRALFANRETVNLLNSSAPMFFHDLQSMMWEDLLLHLCRVTDPPRTGRHEHLSVRALPGLVSDEALRKEIQALADDADQKTQFARDWRNRRLAHEELSLGDTAQPLASATLGQVEDALAAICRPVNLLEKRYLDTPVSYEDPIPALGGVDSLLATLEKGVNARRIERELKLEKILRPIAE